MGSVRKNLAAPLIAGGPVRACCAGLLLAVLPAACASRPEASSPVSPAAPAAPVAPEASVVPVAPGAPVAQPDGLTPAQILRTTADTYANCRTYRDSGRAVTKAGAESPGPILFAPFQTAFQRPDRFRFASEYSVPLMKLAWIVWRRGPALRTWSRHDGYERPESLELALAALAGVSAGSSTTVPKLLMADAVPGAALTEMTDVVRLEDAELGSSHCYCLRGRQPSCTRTLWIDQASHLLLRVVTDLDVDGHKAEVTITYDPVIDEAVPDDLLAFGSPEG